MIRLILEAVKEWVEELLASFRAMYLGYVTPQMYGAKADGVTDDTEAILKALASSNKVFFPQGVYLYTCGKEVTLTDNVTISGDGKNNSIIKYRYTDTARRHGLILRGNNTNLVIENIGIVFDANDGDKFPINEETRMLGINGQFKNIYISNIYMHTGGNAPTLPIHDLVWFKCGAESIKITNALFENFTNNQVGGCVWINPFDDVGSVKYDINNVVVENCEFRNTNSDEALALWITSTDDNKGLHNVFVNANVFTHKDWNGECHTTSNVLTVSSLSNYGMADIHAIVTNNKIVMHRGSGNCVIKSDSVNYILISDNDITIESVGDTVEYQSFFDTRLGEAHIKNNLLRFMPTGKKITCIAQNGNLEYDGNIFIVASQLRLMVKDGTLVDNKEYIFSNNVVKFTEDVGFVIFRNADTTDLRRLIVKGNMIDGGLVGLTLNGKKVIVLDNTFNVAYDTIFNYQHTFKEGSLEWENNKGIVFRCYGTPTTKLTYFKYLGEKDGLQFMKTSTVVGEDTIDKRDKYFDNYDIAYTDCDVKPTATEQSTMLANSDIQTELQTKIADTNSEYLIKVKDVITGANTYVAVANGRFVALTEAEINAQFPN